MDTAAVAARLKQFEGSIAFMYRCTGGKTTVGVGHAIETAADAANLTWVGNPAATAVSADYARVSAAPLGQPAPHYEPLSQCRMSPDVIDALLTADIQTFAGTLTSQLPAWIDYPEPVQQALFDMAYNLGVGGLLKFKQMLAACAAGEWDVAAAQSHRMGISDARNNAIADLFRQAG